MRLTGLLQLPVLSGARLLTERHTDRPIRWVAVIEWPVEDFVGDGELVLTTGLGCEPPQLHEMIDEIAAAKPAAILLTEGADAVHKAIPDTLVAIAERHRVPLVAIPWRTRFSDISRVVIEDLYAEPYAMPRPADELPGPLTRALLGAGGVTAIAAASEAISPAGGHGGGRGRVGVVKLLRARGGCLGVIRWRAWKAAKGPGELPNEH